MFNEEALDSTVTSEEAMELSFKNLHNDFTHTYICVCVCVYLLQGAEYFLKS